ncbi:MAG: multicopper oxidase domain-containing protein [Candidatus Kapaibacterium sp.]
MSSTLSMRFLQTVFVLSLCAGLMYGTSLHATTLPIPDTMSGKSFTLSIRDTFMQIRTGNQTITSGVNAATFWGPTLFMNKGDTVRMTVINKHNDSTTVHWHGMHLPAVMDGGPHQIIPPGTVWQPYWKVTNQASTLWYHPHLPEMTQEQMTKGVGGFIIIRDEQEAALELPRTYGVDDIPLVFTSRRFTNNNQFVTAKSAYGDYLFANGVMDATVTLPRQFVRLRILNAEIERAFNIGFSDNRKFWLIAPDGGLIETPLELTRMRLGVGERAEILVDIGTLAQGAGVDLKAFNAGLPFGFPGGEPQTNGQFGSLLNNKDFIMLKITAGAPTANGITALPSSLIKNTYWKASDAKVMKSVSVTGGIPGPPPGNLFTLDNKAFAFSRIDNTVTLDDTVAWTVTNSRVFTHSFHIHDVMFKIVARNGNPAAVGAWEQGWKDVAYLPTNESVTFVAKFDDYADTSHPFMYHCHFANHEDEGMMGQFIVKPLAVSTVEDEHVAPQEFTLYPNPATDRLHIRLEQPDAVAYYISVEAANGRNVLMLPQPDIAAGIDISRLAAGTYFVRLTDKRTKSVTTRSFIKQ